MIEQYPLLKRIIQFALEEDLGEGDVTTDAIIGPEATGQATLLAREELVLAGLQVFKQVFMEIGPGVEFKDFYKDGDLVPAAGKVCMLTGPLTVILKGERSALNFLQRMSGIATLTRRHVEKAGSTKLRVLDTRKTVPGLRWLDKYAVRTGGGSNHRFCLSDGILIKDNHIAAAGSITTAIRLARKNAPHTLKVEVEVEDLAGVEEALKAGADIIMLDNMDPKQMKKAVKMVGGKALIEASGGINLETIKEVAKTGIDFISVGALTHSPKAADFSLEIGNF
ncbi:putative nicotinate-nucleotide pyrophosphorylase (carboxylating) [uncultured Desulfobacterium sp.]|uniref:Probable nicotinate-nucleotide pyrophosphorylase [carboxylating] n=1 Tax=uncultured Desulfobacterium sp. TaxID=201089 RepID=A0A445MT64_9BACT|nr:putative nicotinate-nucleotide pyrophosphorylase (carboxylating) [uncultured Desulfobacterium sp.]